jgi:energy-coupling factor transport system ATP-binding protein
VLELKQAAFTHPNGLQAIRGVSLTLEPGATLGVMGENGSGKTTLARLMCGLLKPTTGQVLLDGLSTADPACVHEVRRRVGIVFQDPDEQLIETTVEREIGFGLRNLGLEAEEVERRVDRALDLFDIDRLRRRSCHLLSAGEKQTVTVASIFAMEPDYVVLDEATSLLDAESRVHLVRAVDRLISETGAGLVFISMRLEDLWMCDRVLVLGQGSVEFEGNRAGLAARLAGEDYLPGLAYLLGGMEEALPGFGKRMAAVRDLSAETVYGVISEMTRSLGGEACL